MNANEARLQFKGLRGENSYFFQENISGVGEKAAERKRVHKKFEILMNLHVYSWVSIISTGR